MIKLEGGYIQPLVSQWRDAATNKLHHYWLGYSSWTGEQLQFFDKASAELFVWAINERCASQARRQS